MAVKKNSAVVHTDPEQAEQGDTFAFDEAFGEWHSQEEGYRSTYEVLKLYSTVILYSYCTHTRYYTSSAVYDVSSAVDDVIYTTTTSFTHHQHNTNLLLHSFHTSSTPSTVFAGVAPLVVSALDGYNVCIFAYGQVLLIDCAINRLCY
jgi:hypothetical protein